MSISRAFKRLFKRRRRRGKRRGWRFPRKLILPFLLLAAGFSAYIAYDLPDISGLGEVRKAPSIVIKTEDGTVIGTYGDIYGDYVPYKDLPQDLIRAVVATEDRNFFHHFGVDPFGIARAMYVNLRVHHFVQGGSTITQQLAKNAFLTPARTLKRKLQEMILAVKLERHYTKQDIITIYLNRVYMGAGNYGVDAASRRYFGHSVREATLPEAAILVGLLKAPSRYAPTSNPDLSEKRATQVLINMQKSGYITEAQIASAKKDFAAEDEVYRDSHGFGAFYFTDWVVGQLPEYVGEVQQDLVVTTTLNPAWQRVAEDAVDDVLDQKGQAMKASQAALLSITPDGAIRAMVGGKSYRASQFNRVTQAVRQPGSAFKLFVYLAALEAGWTPDHQMEDKPIAIGRWRPKDYTGKYEGMVTLREAFAQSINSIAVQLGQVVGMDRVVDMARKLGITSELNPDPSLALGTNEVTLFDMTKAYAHLAANGGSVYPYAIRRIEATDGHVLFERKNAGGGEVLTQNVVGMMNNMLMAVTTTGTGRAAQFGRPVAGKTGTTSDYRDAWFVGFVPQLITGVWVGNDDTAPMKKVTGGSLPAIIWRAYMMNATKGMAVADIPSYSGGMMGGGFLPWIFGGSGNSTGPAGPSSPSPKMMQNIQPGTSAPVPAPHAHGPALGGAVSPDQPIPEDEPAPRYDASPSFWDKLTGGDNQ